MGYTLRHSPQVYAMSTLHWLSGLGADCRLFEPLFTVPGMDQRCLPYLHPLECSSLGEYAELLIDYYELQAGCAIGGVSLGGMIAQEISARLHPEKVVLLSTVTSRDEYPWWLTSSLLAKLKPLITADFLRSLGWLGDKFTLKSTRGRAVFFKMLADANDDFMVFAAKAILDWKGCESRGQICRIHGCKDRLFPAARLSGSYIRIPGGQHFMVYENAPEIGGIIRQFLQQH